MTPNNPSSGMVSVPRELLEEVHGLLATGYLRQYREAAALRLVPFLATAPQPSHPAPCDGRIAEIVLPIIRSALDAAKLAASDVQIDFVATRICEAAEWQAEAVEAFGVIAALQHLQAERGRLEEQNALILEENKMLANALEPFVNYLKLYGFDGFSDNELIDKLNTLPLSAFRKAKSAHDKHREGK